MFSIIQELISTHRLIHQAKSNLVVVLILSRNLRPETGKLSISRTTLANDRFVPPSIVVNVNDTESGAGVQTSLDLLIVGVPGVGVEGSAKVVVEEKLPTDGNAESVHAIVFGEVVHLVHASLARVDDAGGLAGAIDGAAEIEAGNLFQSHGQPSDRSS